MDTTILTRLELLAKRLEQEGRYTDRNIVELAFNAIHNLMDAAWEGVNQIDAAHTFLPDTKGDGQSHSPLDCAKSGREIILATLRSVDAETIPPEGN